MVTQIAFYSTLVLTLLIAVGLFFFLRASVKDRTQQATFISDVAPEILRPRLTAYFQQRAYRLVESGTVLTYRGTVQPSLFLAVFLSLLALAGLGSVGLVFAFLTGSSLWFGFVILAPIAGIFYWRKAQRPEAVQLRLDIAPQTTHIHVKAHRDELEKFKLAFGFED